MKEYLLNTNLKYIHGQIITKEQKEKQKKKNNIK